MGHSAGCLFLLCCFFYLTSLGFSSCRSTFWDVIAWSKAQQVYQLKQSKALFICILVSDRRLISGQSGGTAYLAVFILPKHTCRGSLENMPVINFKLSLTKQLKHGHKNSIKSFPPLSTDPQVASQHRARTSALAGAKQDWMRFAPARQIRAAEPSTGGRGVRWEERSCLLQVPAGWLTETPHTPPYTKWQKDVLPPLSLGLCLHQPVWKQVSSRQHMGSHNECHCILHTSS